MPEKKRMQNAVPPMKPSYTPLGNSFCYLEVGAKVTVGNRKDTLKVQQCYSKIRNNTVCVAAEDRVYSCVQTLLTEVWQYLKKCGISYKRGQNSL